MKLPLNRLVSKLVNNTSSAGKNEISKCYQYVTFESRFLALLADINNSVITWCTGNTVRKVSLKAWIWWIHQRFCLSFFLLKLGCTKLINLLLEVHVRHLVSVVFGAGNSNFEAFEIDVICHLTRQLKSKQVSS